MKPILFNTDMVRAILDGTKTATRRVVKPQPEITPIQTFGGSYRISMKGNVFVKPPYRPGDILYVRETFKIDYLSNIPGSGRIHYKADDTYRDFTFSPERYEIMRQAQLKPGWRPNENMPREAARIFLRVTGVKVQRVQGITEEEARKEGAKKMYPYTDPETGGTVYAYSEDGTYIAGFTRVWNNCYAKPRPVKVKGIIDHYESYPWEDIQETRAYRGKPWYVFGNPWVWAIGFERISKEEASAYA